MKVKFVDKLRNDVRNEQKVLKWFTNMHICAVSSNQYLIILMEIRSILFDFYRALPFPTIWSFNHQRITGWELVVG